MASTTVRGRFVWHELYTPNLTGAQEFYGQAVGWTAQAWEQDPEHELFVATSGPLGAVVEERSGTPQWLAYIGTTDVDATVEAAARLGGQVQTAPTELPNGGRYAVLTDPQGARFGVHASASTPQPEATARAGEFSWHELATNVAPGAAFGFYAALFDWDLVSEFDMGPMGMYLVFGRNGRQLGGMFDQSKGGKQGAAYWLGYVSVTDLERTVERAKSARGSVLVGPMDVPGGDRIAQLMDPYGAFFALHKAASPAAATDAARGDARKPAKQAARKKAGPRREATQKRAAKKRRAKQAKPKARKKTRTKRPVKKKPARKSTAKRKPKRNKKAARKSRTRGR